MRHLQQRSRRRRRSPRRRVAAIVLCLFASRAAFAQTNAQLVHGVVHDSAGAGIAHAQVRVAGSQPVFTDADGKFAIPVAQSAALLAVRRLGFQPGEMEIEPASLGRFPVDIVLTPVARSLEAVSIRARREPFDARLAGFNQRLARKAGYFITREQIERNPNSQLIDALRRLPGVRVVNLRGAQGRSVNLGGARCPPLVFVDGFPATAGAFDLDMVELGSLEGVEVYSSTTAIPAELMGPGGPSQCGVIAVWSSPVRLRQPVGEREHLSEDLSSLVDAHTVFTADQVDQPARYEEGSAEPVYPSSQIGSRAHGRVVVEFVVDTLGGVEPATINVVTATNSAFADAARLAAERGRFAAAMLKGRRVRQVVRLGLDFDPGALLPAPADTSKRSAARSQ